MAGASPPLAVQFKLLNITQFSDGSIHRAPHDPPPLPACPSPASPLAVATSDIALSSPSSPAAAGHARLFLPPAPPPPQKLPILLHFHGGGFIYGSCSLPADHTFLCKLAAHANVLIVAVDYRLAPEHPLPAAYVDGLEALEWLKGQSKLGEEGAEVTEPWLAKHGDFGRVFLGGDSAGANIAYQVGMAAAGRGGGFERGEGGGEGRRKAEEGEEACVVQGMILIHPFFTCGRGEEEGGGLWATTEVKMWELSGVSVEHPYANPLHPEAPALQGAPLPRSLVAVASKDVSASRGLAFYKALVDARQTAKLFISPDEEHIFHLLTPDSPNVLPFLEELKGFITHP